MIIQFRKAVGKKDDRNYVQIRGHVRKDVARRFKQFCLDQEIDYSEGLETILTTFFAADAQITSGDLDCQNNSAHFPCYEQH